MTTSAHALRRWLRGTFAAAALLLACAASAQAQQYAFAWNPRTGDAWIDRQLADINAYGDRYRGAFIDELVRYHAAPRELVTELVTRRNWAPGDVYFACALAQVAGRPCRRVIEDWEQAHADGWSKLMAQLALPDRRDATARLKQDITASYARWGRPLAEPEAEDGATKQKKTGS